MAALADLRAEVERLVRERGASALTVNTVRASLSQLFALTPEQNAQLRDVCKSVVVAAAAAAAAVASDGGATSSDDGENDGGSSKKKQRRSEKDGTPKGDAELDERDVQLKALVRMHRAGKCAYVVQLRRGDACSSVVTVGLRVFVAVQCVHAARSAQRQGGARRGIQRAFES
jgi:hypothetical protein